MYYLTTGGIMMYFILGMSIIGLMAIIERTLYFIIYESGGRNYLSKEVKEFIEEGDIKSAGVALGKDKSSVTKVLKDILAEIYKNPNVSIEKLEERAKEKAMQRVTLLERNMWIIALVAYITPLLGLLGTVMGMIKAFQAIAAYGTGDASILAKGISEALFTTAGGLFVAVPAIIFYNYFNKKIDQVISDMEITSTELINYFRK